MLFVSAITLNFYANTVINAFVILPFELQSLQLWTDGQTIGKSDGVNGIGTTFMRIDYHSLDHPN